MLLPPAEFVETAEYAIDEVFDVMGCATIEAVLRMSAEQFVGLHDIGCRLGKGPVGLLFIKLYKPPPVQAID